MILYHTYIPDYYLDSSILNFNDNILTITRVLKICVSIYAFLTGYAYFYCENKNIKYSISKIWQLLERYWIQLFTIFIPVALFFGYKLTIKNFIINLFGLLPNINYFAWYVFFYIFVMLILPYIHFLFKDKAIINFTLALFIPYGIEVILRLTPFYETSTIIHDLFSCFLYLPCVLVGYLVAKHNIYEKINNRINISIFLSIIGVFIIFLMRYFIDSIFGLLLDSIYSTMLIYFLSKIFNYLIDKQSNIIKLFIILGTYSTSMWFFHAVFFSEYLRNIMQPAILIGRYPFLIFLLTITFSLIGAYLFETFISILNKLYLIIYDSN